MKFSVKHIALTALVLWLTNVVFHWVKGTYSGVELFKMLLDIGFGMALLVFALFMQSVFGLSIDKDDESEKG